MIVGLGNVGTEFARTRHNSGFGVCKLFCNEYAQNLASVPNSEGIQKKSGQKFSCYITNLGFSQTSVHGLDMVDRVSERAMLKTKETGVLYPDVHTAFMFPTTYMNCSGQAVTSFVDRNNFRLKRAQSKSLMDEICVVHDDLSIPFGEIRISPKGGSSGQNGVESIIKALGTEHFIRMRIGIGATSDGRNNVTDKVKEVIGKWNGSQLRRIPTIWYIACEALRVYIHRGCSAAASCVNSKPCSELLEQLFPEKRIPSNWMPDDVIRL